MAERLIYRCACCACLCHHRSETSQRLGLRSWQRGSCLSRRCNVSESISPRLALQQVCTMRLVSTSQQYQRYATLIVWGCTQRVLMSVPVAPAQVCSWVNEHCSELNKAYPPSHVLYQALKYHHIYPKKKHCNLLSYQRCCDEF